MIAKKYTLTEDLGPGDSGQLFLAEQTTLLKLVVAKIIDPELSANEEFAAKVLREARILSLVRHANVARLMSYGTTESGAVYLIYEYLEGSDLGSLQAGTQRFPWPRAKGLILQVLGALRVAHGKGIVHGGVRPSNVFMVDAGDGLDHVKLTAFGLSPAPRLDIFSGPELLEVAEFAAPEEAEGKPFDVRADVYSVGVLLYSLLTGSVPFTAKEPHQVVTQHTMASPPPPRNIAPDADIPPPVEAVILRCLAKAPEDRYPDLGALEHDLREISDEGKVPRRGSAGAPVGAAAGGAMSQIGAQPTKDSALFYSIEALQGMLATAPSPDDQLQVLDKMDRALNAMAGEAKDSEDYLRWSQWINQGRDYAYFQLGQRHSEAKRWRELEAVYLRRLELATDDDAVHKLMGSLADLYLRHILNYDKAIEIYRALIDADDGALEAHLGLAQALERKQEIEDAIPHYERFVELCTDSKRCADQLAHLGGLHHKLSETDSAIARLYQATELAPGHLEALKLLADLFRARHEWIELVEALEAIVEHTTSSYERVERATEAGFVWLEKLQVKDRAIQMFAKVVEIDPENAKVGPILGKIYYEQKNYVAAAPIFDALVRKIDNLGLRDTSKVGVLVRAGQVARAIGSTSKASKLFKRALDIDPESSHALVGVAELAMVRKSWDEARMAYEKLLGRRQGDAKASVHVKLAEIALAQGRSDIAIQNYKEALGCDPKNVHAHSGLAEIYADNKDWRGLLKAHQGRLPTLEGDAKAGVFVEIGKIFRDHLGEPGRAVAAFQRAHELRPDDKTLLHTLLDLHTEAKRWPEVMPILDELIAGEQEPKRRAKYLYTSAAIQRDNLDNPDEALGRFDMVLDDDREFLKAFQAIDTILTKRKDWKALERAYRKMIKRLPADDKSPLKQLLWHNLAEIYRSRVGDYASAAKALEVALSLDPSNFKRQLMVTELYGMLMQQDPAQYTDALIRSHSTLIRLDPSYYRSYHQLYNIYRQQNEIDKAYCVARTLLFLKQATDEEGAFYRSGPPAVFRQARLRLSDDTLRRTVLPGDQDPTVTMLLGLVDPALATWRSKPAPPQLRDSEPIDTAESPSLPAQALSYVARIINVQQPELHFLRSEPGDITIHSVRRRGGEVEQVAIARGSLLRQERTDGEVVFEVARHLLELYPPHHAFFLLERSPKNLGQLLVACSVLAERGSGDGGQGVQVIIQELVNRLPPANLEKVKALARELGQTDVKRWARAAAIAGYRLGLLLSNDLEAAAKAIRSEQRSSAVNITGKDALTELIVYSVSEAYFEARRSVGLAVA
ncbi:MAG: tetratricopeptide repeat protein [Nannocystaceae bacterium]